MENNEKTIGIRFSYSEKEYKDAIKWYYLQSKTIRLDFLVSVILILTGSFLLQYDVKSIIAIIATLSGVAFLGMLIFAIFFLPSKNFRKEPKFRDEYYFNFGEDRIMFLTDNINSTINWNHFIKYNENKEFYYLIYGKLRFTIVPKRAFKSIEEENEFKSLLKRKLKFEQQVKI